MLTLRLSHATLVRRSNAGQCARRMVGFLVLLLAFGPNVNAQVDPHLLDTQDGGVGNALGFSVVTVDTNHDGQPDFLACGCPFDDGPNNDLPNSGCVTIFNYITGAKVVDIFPSPASAGDFFGARLAAGGDIDGNPDGKYDLLIGAPLADVQGVTNAGRVFVVSGTYLDSPQGSAIRFVVDPPFPVQANAQFGDAVAVIGDVNLDLTQA
jgi:FG-GAP repeat protein